jgi:UDP-N-acetylglucosamine acyltransferase
MGIHPTAIVAPGAELGEDVEIGPYCMVGPKVKVGARTRLVSHVVVDGDTWLGEDNELFPFCVIGCYPQDKKLKPGDPIGRLRIGRFFRGADHAVGRGHHQQREEYQHTERLADDGSP